MIYLIRHAEAGDRTSWNGTDFLRPLTDAGRFQASRLVELLGDAHFSRIASSPFIRCMQTVEPLSSHLQLLIEPVDALAEGANVSDTLALLSGCSQDGAVFCSHGDVIPNLLGYLAATTALDLGHDPRCAKGSIWALATDGLGNVTTATYSLVPKSRCVK